MVITPSMMQRLNNWLPRWRVLKVLMSMMQWYEKSLSKRAVISMVLWNLSELHWKMMKINHGKKSVSDLNRINHKRNMHTYVPPSKQVKNERNTSTIPHYTILYYTILYYTIRLTITSLWRKNRQMCFQFWHEWKKLS